MRTVGDIYEAYRIPPWLQEHQLRVAAVGKMVCGIRPEAHEQQVILACLFHDMGNILKFDFVPDGPLVSLMAEKGMDYWKQVHDDFLRTYGKDEHEAAIIIGRELGLSEEVVRVMDGINFWEIDAIKRNGPLELQIAEYADMRVAPFGVVLAAQRLADIKKRYEPRWAAEGFRQGGIRDFDEKANLLVEMETELFKGASLQPGDINDTSVAPLVEELKKYEIS